MKKVLLALVAAFTVTIASAQLPSGSICPDFTGTDLDGNTWNLYDLLDQGYVVVIDVSATWCGPCWGYHNSGALETLHEMYGPDGTNEVRVFFVEGDGSTTNADLNGTGGNTQGDWVEGTGYPIIDDSDIADLLQIAYFPTIYTVCPSRIITETGQASAADHYSFISANACEAASLATDPSIIGISAQSACTSADVMVELQNFGTTALTSATITVTGGTSPVVYNWSGNLDTYEIEEVNVGSVALTGSTMLTATITSTDGNTANNSAMVSAGAAQSSTHIRIDILFDNWPEEVSWVIVDSDDNVVASGDNYAGLNNEPLTVDAFVPGTGCFTFVYTDGYGDGLHGAQYGNGNIDGHMYVYGIDAGGNAMAAIYDYDGSYNLGTAANTPASESRNANVTSVVGVEEFSVASGFNVYPNPSNGLVNLNYSLTANTKVSVEVVDMLGNIVMFQNMGTQNTGSYTNTIDMTSLSAGVYMMNVKTNDVVNTIRVTMSK